MFSTFSYAQTFGFLVPNYILTMLASAKMAVLPGGSIILKVSRVKQKCVTQSDVCRMFIDWRHFDTRLLDMVSRRKTGMRVGFVFTLPPGGVLQ